MKICVPIVEKKIQQVIVKMKNAFLKKADLIEIWCGEVEDLNLEKIFQHKKLPLVLNCKAADEKGSFLGNETEKLTILTQGAKMGAEFCDFSVTTQKEIIEKFVQNKGKTKLILSTHFWQNTPPLPALLNTAVLMKKLKADILKFATYSRSGKDLLTTLRLAENLQRKNIQHICISMGKIGKISRFLIPQIFSSEFTFTPLSKEDANAPGQISFDELKALMKILN